MPDGEDTASAQPTRARPQRIKTLALLFASILAGLAFLEAGSRVLFRADVAAQATSLLPRLVRVALIGVLGRASRVRTASTGGL